ncbi:MAG TPA: hypothetical protein VJ815_06510 [Acidimicrobiia bacterium]|nr:hypothetical protein [Acidimicrobiia bacterium]
MRGRLVVAVLVFGLVIAMALPALAAQPANANCWGVVSSQAAQEGGLGEHSSSFAGEPRLGLGNVARLVIGADAHVSDLGTALAELDDIAATSCP